jgi:hypothetical protein
LDEDNSAILPKYREDLENAFHPVTSAYVDYVVAVEEAEQSGDNLCPETHLQAKRVMGACAECAEEFSRLGDLSSNPEQ